MLGKVDIFAVGVDREEEEAAAGQVQVQGAGDVCIMPAMRCEMHEREVVEYTAGRYLIGHHDCIC